jgi:cell wall-associated NlpC family hydrolase
MKPIIYPLLFIIFLSGCSTARNNVSKRYPQKKYIETAVVQRTQEVKEEIKEETEALPETEEEAIIEITEMPTEEGSDILQIANRYLGTRYRYGGTTPAGFDCSGFVCYVFGEAGYTLPRSSGEQARMGESVGRNSLQPGDLVFFKGSNSKSKSVGHAGIVTENTGDGTFNFIHSATSSGVRVDSSESIYWNIRYLMAKRVTEKD